MSEEYLKEEEKVKELLMHDKPVVLKNPGMKAFPDFLKVARDLSKAGENASVSDMMNNFSNESIDALTNLINLTIKKSFPDEDKEFLDEWAMENNISLMTKVISLCSPKKSRTKQKKEDIINKLKSKQE
jgi:chemotaxis protein CheY-P-specific phosphatase CheC